MAQDLYLSLTCHYITVDFSQQQVCLHEAPFNDHHIAEHIAAMINKCFHSWSVTSKVHVVVRDNGSNFVAGLRDAGIPNKPCLAHTLQLVVKDQCLAQPVVVDLTAKAYKLFGYYKHFKIPLQLLLKIHRIISKEINTRWTH